jgi:type I restriction enzyme S subunit
MTAQDLKNSILQLAIQGKLVEQRSEEGTAKELVEQIKAEKEQLIIEKKIKKEKPLPEITEEEIPFEIPESWEWVRLRTIVFNRGQITPIDKFSYIDIGSINNECQRLNEQENIIEPENAPSRARKLVDKGDILYSTVRPYLHNMCIIDKEFSYTPIASTGFAAMTSYPGIYNKYLFYYLLSPEFDRYANSNDNAKGVAYPAINDDRLYRAIIALPPLHEQKRIVAKIEELLPYVEQYDKAYSKLEVFNKKFPEDMQKSILQYAIQGKLVEQRPEEGTAEELYQQIQAEKERLIKEGKIKKEKPLGDITDEEIPFEIPESWKWVRLGSLSELITKGSSPSWQGIQYVEQGLLFVTSENVGTEELLLNNPKYLEERFNEIQERSILKTGDVLTNIVGASIGRAAIYDREDKANINQAVCLIRLVNKSLGKYIVKYLNSYVAYQIMMRDKVDTARANISLTNINDFIIPLPPLNEQQRIVEAIEIYLPYCKQLVK